MGECTEGKRDPRLDTIKGRTRPGEIIMVDDIGKAVMGATPEERKKVPIYSGVLRYFPLAIAEVARCSYQGNEQHNPGTPLHWDRFKSGDEHDALVRHLMEAGTMDKDGVRHSAKVAWRALAALQKELENG
jgi:hypothetical protein